MWFGVCYLCLILVYVKTSCRQIPFFTITATGHKWIQWIQLIQWTHWGKTQMCNNTYWLVRSKTIPFPGTDAETRFTLWSMTRKKDCSITDISWFGLILDSDRKRVILSWMRIAWLDNEMLQRCVHCMTLINQCSTNQRLQSLVKWTLKKSLRIIGIVIGI